MIGAGRMLRIGAMGAVCPKQGPQPPVAKKPVLAAMMAKVKNWLRMGATAA